MNFSYRGWVKNTKNTFLPQFLNGFMVNKKYRIAITYPISIKNNSGSANYAGLVGVVIPTEELFSYMATFMI
jgi:hypothetical protein